MIPEPFKAYLDGALAVVFACAVFGAFFYGEHRQEVKDLKAIATANQRADKASQDLKEANDVRETAAEERASAAIARGKADREAWLRDHGDLVARLGRMRSASPVRCEPVPPGSKTVPDVHGDSSPQPAVSGPARPDRAGRVDALCAAAIEKADEYSIDITTEQQRQRDIKRQANQ